ncbi:MAG: threonylcarbamoyl-AMP synthase [Clostridia bacterium]|nr:threonylcarbamoyl-AMP synthase [Clostridia bacterium]
MNTQLLLPTKKNISLVGQALLTGNLVGIPTETVYGLAANALDGNAVNRIFAAKGRPADNPLIVHISDIDQIEKFSLVSEIPESAKKLMAAFWPGPLTIIMKKGCVPNEVTAGLDTVAVRFPSHVVTQRIITAAGCPLAAPSANTSGKPSPTTAAHVFHDMNGKIPYIIDGGACEVGVESTVVTTAGDVPVLLRPGGVTHEQLESVVGHVEIAHAVLERMNDGETAASPGMKYKHYAPSADVILLSGSSEQYISFVNEHISDNTAALCYDEDVDLIGGKTYSLGHKDNYEEQSANLFSVLRLIDEEGYNTIYARCPERTGTAMALYNRLIRAAGFEVMELA